MEKKKAVKKEVVKEPKSILSIIETLTDVPGDLTKLAITDKYKELPEDAKVAVSAFFEGFNHFRTSQNMGSIRLTTFQAQSLFQKLHEAGISELKTTVQIKVGDEIVNVGFHRSDNKWVADTQLIING